VDEAVAVETPKTRIQHLTGDDILSIGKAAAVATVCVSLATAWVEH